MWRIPFLQANPTRACVNDLNKAFARLTGEWGYYPGKGFQCEVPHELAEPYCKALNDMAGKPVATQKESHDIAVSRPFAMDLGIITLDPELLIESNLMESLCAEGGTSVFRDIHKEWSSRICGGMKAAQFSFHSPRS